MRIERIKQFWLIGADGLPYWHGDTVTEKLKNFCSNGPGALVAALVISYAAYGAGCLLRPLWDRF